MRTDAIMPAVYSHLALLQASQLQIPQDEAVTSSTKQFLPLFLTIEG